MGLNQNLLYSKEQFDFKSSLNGTNIKGSYNTMQFVLRLRDDVRYALNNSEIESERLQASSTSLHENIHWWQHIGSNYGFLLSLSYPSFAHEAKVNLDNLVSKKLLFKSILKYDEKYYDIHKKTDNPDINTILNNYHDLEYAKAFAIDNKNIHEILKDRRFFLSIGHCYHIFWSLSLNAIASTIDREYLFLPNANDWVSNFIQLEKNKVAGFYIDTPMHISSLGIKAIFEGQAIFNQMQYLTVTLNKNLTYKDFENAGMLHGIYLEAFEVFLKITGLNKPANALDPVVGLFLLICDLSINPNNGFPLDIYDYKNFISKNDPGIRFSLLCRAISNDANSYVKKINHYTKEEYILLSKDYLKA